MLSLLPFNFVFLLLKFYRKEQLPHTRFDDLIVLLPPSCSLVPRPSSRVEGGSGDETTPPVLLLTAYMFAKVCILETIKTEWQEDLGTRVDYVTPLVTILLELASYQVLHHGYRRLQYK